MLCRDSGEDARFCRCEGVIILNTLALARIESLVSKIINLSQRSCWERAERLMRPDGKIGSPAAAEGLYSSVLH
jgi:hypothetical protein